jgi:small GTP-binding protein
MPINAGYEYIAAEKKYLNAATMEERIAALQEMISKAPSHKGGENLRAELRLRLKKLLEKKEKAKSVGKSSKKGVKKEGFQVVLIGLPNSGKSSLLAKITNARPLITEHPFATREPEIGTLDYQGVKAQIVDLPSIGSELFDIGIVNTADLVLILVENLSEIDKITSMLNRAYGKKIIVITKSDLLNEEQLRKLEQTIRSKKINAIPISTVNDYNIETLKSSILKSMDVIRVYTKEPGKPKAENPCVLPVGSTVKDVAESIRNGFFKTIKETRITGPSSKFANQKVGIEHVLKDLDTVEFHTR